MKKLLFAITLCLACMHTGLLWSAEVIVLTDLYAVMPLDNRDGGIIVDEGDGNRIVATLDGHTLTVKVPAQAGNTQVIVTRTDTGVTAADRYMTGTEERITLNASGRYMIEVYTDTKAVGGAFEVK